MKKSMLILVGLAVLIITYLCEFALSSINDGHWTNYTHFWNMKLPKQKKMNVLKRDTPDHKIELELKALQR